MLTLAVAFVAGRPAGGRQAAIGLVIGCGLSVGLQLVLGTWDAVWRDGWTGWVVAVVARASASSAPPAALVAFTTASRRRPTGRPRRLWALGLFLALAAMIVANPAFVGVAVRASRSAGRGSWSSSRTRSVPGRCCDPTRGRRGVRVGAAVLLVAGVGVRAVAHRDRGARRRRRARSSRSASCCPRRSAPTGRRPRGIPRTGAATLVVGLGTIGPLLLYMLDYDVPLPVDNVWVIVLAALGLALSGLRRRTPGAVPALTSPDRLPARTSSVRLLILPAVVLAADRARAVDHEHDRCRRARARGRRRR